MKYSGIYTGCETWEPCWHSYDSSQGTPRAKPDLRTNVTWYYLQLICRKLHRLCL